MEMYLIHPQIFEDNRICSTAKLLFSLICNLSIKDGVCTASNNYLGEKLSLKKERISKLITELVKYDYIKSECKYKENTKHYFEERILTPLSLNFTIPININDYTYSIKKLYPMSFNDVGMSLNDGTDLLKTSNAVELPIIKNDVGISLNDGTQLNDNTPMSLNAYEIHNNNNNNNKLSKGKNKDKKIKDHVFSDSIYFNNYDLFLEHAAKIVIDYPNVDIKYYYECIRDYVKHDTYKYSDWMRVLRNWIKNSIERKGDYVKVKIEEPKHEKLNPEGKRYFLHSTEHERIHNILKKQNAREILESFFGIKSIEDLSQQLDYVLTKHEYSATEIWNRK